MLLASACFSGARPASALRGASPVLLRPRPQLAQRRRHFVALQIRSNAADSFSSSSNNSDSRVSGGSSSELSPPTLEQAAAADRLLALSREVAQHRSRGSYSSDEQLRQRILLLLQLGFSEAAVEQHIRNKKGGPYAAWGTVGELVALLRREGFSQQHLDSMLAGRGTRDTAAGDVYSRAPADIAANLAWLRQQFGLEPADLAKACWRSSALLQYKAETLQANWRAIVETYRPTAAAMPRLAYALRAGDANFLLLTLATVSNKAAGLQELLGLSDRKLPDKFGTLACLFDLDLHATGDGPAQRFELLQELTGLAKEKLGMSILRFPTLLQQTSVTLLRKHDAIVEALGGDAATAKLLLSRCPDALQGAEDRVPRNMATLQRLGCSSLQAAKQVLLANGRLAKLDLERPAFAARVAYWRQAYRLESAEAAMLKCTEMLDRSLHTVAPRVAFWRSCRPGQPLSAISRFTPGDATFCARQHLPAEQFPAFKQRWLASQEGCEVCRWERQQEVPAACAAAAAAAAATTTKEEEEQLSFEPDD